MDTHQEEELSESIKALHDLIKSKGYLLLPDDIRSRIWEQFNIYRATYMKEVSKLDYAAVTFIDGRKIEGYLDGNNTTLFTHEREITLSDKTVKVIRVIRKGEKNDLC